MTAVSGSPVRSACATIRLSVSWTARAFAIPVSASVAAWRSAFASVRRLARIGAAWVTESPMRASSASESGCGWRTSTEPMTWPPTSDGTQVASPAAGSRPHRSHGTSGGALPPWRCARP